MNSDVGSSGPLAPNVLPVTDGEDMAPGKRSLNRAWLITFTDLISLMLTFFVLLFSMSSVKLDNWDMLTDTLSRSLRPVIQEAPPLFKASRFNISTLVERDAENLDYLASVIEELTSKDELLANSTLTRLDDRLIVGLPGQAMFEEANAVMNGPAQAAIFELSSILRNVDNRIGVNGYSASNQDEGGAYTSDWELSIARAMAVSNYLGRSGVDQDITAYGFANSRYNGDSDTGDAGLAQIVERVDIVIFPSASKQ